MSTVLVATFILTVTPFIGIVNGAKPVDVLFGVPMESFMGNSLEIMHAGASDNWIAYASTSGDLIGDIEGKMTAQAHWIWHKWVGPEMDPDLSELEKSNGGAVLTIEAETVFGTPVSGTITLKFVVRGNEFAGTWVIIGGTEDLNGITGQGTWSSFGLIDSIPSQVFEGKIHFNP